MRATGLYPAAATFTAEAAAGDFLARGSCILGGPLTETNSDPPSEFSGSSCSNVASRARGKLEMPTSECAVPSSQSESAGIAVSVLDQQSTWYHPWSYSLALYRWRRRPMVFQRRAR
uniref:Uncharacterized protein n=1 Tax=Hyaloperonospora arabidopsidis (strain Emoy2) TaxID=559515 RepID=M4BLE6_HYAAE